MFLASSGIAVYYLRALQRVREEERIIMLKKKAIGAFVAAATLLSGFAFASLAPVAFANDGSGDTNQTEHSDNDVINFASDYFKEKVLDEVKAITDENGQKVFPDNLKDITYGQAKRVEFLNLSADVYGYSKDKDGHITYMSTKPSPKVVDISDLRYFPNLTHLRLSFTNVENLKPLKNLTKLTHLAISGCEKVSDFSVIQNLKNLENLNVSENIQLKNINFVKDLTNINRLEFNGTSVSDVKPLEKLNKMTWLDFHSTKVSDISALNNMKELQFLSFSETGVSDIDVVKNFKKLDELYMEDTKVTDLTPISDITNLVNLKANSYVAHIKSLKPLEKLTRLSMVTVYGNGFTSDLSELKNHNELTLLQLNNINVTNIDALKTATDLRDLEIHGALTDISALKDHNKLEFLSIASPNLYDISALSTATALESFSLYGSKVSNVQPLSGLTKLNYLSISCNPITDISSLKSASSLRSLYVDNRVSKESIETVKKAIAGVNISVVPSDVCPANYGIPTPDVDSSSTSTVSRLDKHSSPKLNSSISKTGSQSAPESGEYWGSEGSGDPDWDSFDSDDFGDSDGSDDFVSNAVSDSAPSALDSLTPALDDNIDFSEMLDMADFDVDALGDLSDSGNMNVGDFTGTDSADNSGDAGIPSGVDDFNIGDFDLSDFDFADLLDDLGDLDLDDLATADVADAGSSVPAVPVGVVAR